MAEELIFKPPVTRPGASGGKRQAAGAVSEPGTAPALPCADLGSAIRGGQGRSAEEVTEWGQVLVWLGMIGGCFAVWLALIWLLWRWITG